MLRLAACLGAFGLLVCWCLSDVRCLGDLCAHGWLVLMCVVYVLDVCGFTSCLLCFGLVALVYYTFVCDSVWCVWVLHLLMAGVRCCF